MDTAELFELLAPLLAEHHQLELERCSVGEIQHRPTGTTWVVEAHVRAEPGEDRMYVGVTSEDITSLGATVSTEADAVTMVEFKGTRYGVWMHPHDPILPGLGLASTPRRVQQQFGDVGRLVGLRTVVYRPLRRAVLRAEFRDDSADQVTQSCGGHVVYLKALPAGQAEQLYRQHQDLLAAGVPCAEPVAEPVDDVLALHLGRGESLATMIRRDGAEGLDPEAITEVLDALPAETVMQLPHRASWTDRLDEFVVTARAFVPQAGPRIDRLAEEISQALEVSDPGPLVPVHGDLYEEHILFDPETGKVSSLLDMDSVGPGYRVDDVACLIGHIAVLETVDHAYRAWTKQLVQRLYRHFVVGGAPQDEQALAARAAVVVLSLISTLPHTSHGQTIALRRLDLAELVLRLPLTV